MLLKPAIEALAAHTRAILETAKRPGENRMSFAKRIGVGDGTLGRILSGEGNPTIEVITAIAEAGRMDPWQLLHPGAMQVSEDPATYRHPSRESLTDAIRIAEQIIEDAGRHNLAPEARAAVITAILELQSDGVGMESAKRVVTHLLSTTSKGSSTNGDSPTPAR